MRTLGIDFGESKIGLAIATSMLAEVYGVVRYESVKEVVNKIKKIVEKEKIEKVVIGISEGKMAEKTREFAKALEDELGSKIIFQDETLSTQEAQKLSLQAGIKKRKRRELEDAYAASIMLQSYLDSHV